MSDVSKEAQSAIDAYRKKKITESKRKYMEEHKEELAERKRKYYQEHKEELTERQRNYRKKIKEQRNNEHHPSGTPD